MPLTGLVVVQMMARFRIFYGLLRKSRLSSKKPSAFRTGAIKRKEYFGFRCTIMSSLQVLQNKATKIILHRPLYSSASHALATLKCLNV